MKKKITLIALFLSGTLCVFSKVFGFAREKDDEFAFFHVCASESKTFVAVFAQV